jgi:hypothetical protein
VWPLDAVDPGRQLTDGTAMASHNGLRLLPVRDCGAEIRGTLALIASARLR